MDNGNEERALVKILRIQDGKLSSLLEWPNSEYTRKYGGREGHTRYRCRPPLPLSGPRHKLTWPLSGRHCRLAVENLPLSATAWLSGRWALTA